ncbi:MAG TPA: sensor domain-containing diguanylate cyclase [Terracidiphilus sp.]|nr:sensor domain-containing diguanylate cyclase [Terracidiphilus sp.]
MTDVQSSVSTDPYILMEIIRLQTEIAKLGLDLSGVVNAVVERIPTLTNAEGAIVEYSEGEEMVYRGASGIALPLLGTRVKREASLSGLCVREGRILRSDDTLTDPRVDHGPCEQAGIRSMVIAPLKHEGSAVGAVKLVSTATYAFTARDVRVLELMSDLIAAAMYYAARNESNALYQQATHDSLTGLANRNLFFDRLRSRVSTGRRQIEPLGILVIDMDGLKRVNDSYGHRAGDAALREMALRISRIPRRSDLVARLGGDEFGVILGDISDRNDLLTIVERLSLETDQPFLFEGRTLDLTASIGHARFPEDGKDVDDLLEAADRSMYEMKRTRSVRSSERELTQKHVF